MYDLYQCNEDDTARFILGKNGNKKLFVIGLNPSTANKEKSDTTVAKVEAVASKNGFEGFVMANLYPLRSTDPNGLPEIASEDLIIKNMKAIQELAHTEKAPVFWAAWGGDITIRPYLGIALRRMVEAVKKMNGTWVHYGELTKYGHPRHPSRLSYSWVFSEFDVSNYVQNIA
jgi:hypothetical protein